MAFTISRAVEQMKMPEKGKNKKGEKKAHAELAVEDIADKTDEP